MSDSEEKKVALRTMSERASFCSLAVKKLVMKAHMMMNADSSMAPKNRTRGLESGDGLAFFPPSDSVVLARSRARG